MEGNQHLYHQSEEQLLNEKNIVEAAKKDLKHFETLYNKYHEQIFRYVYQRTDAIDLAHDITSQVFLKAMNKLHQYQYKGVPFSSWLYRIAMSEVYQYFKDKKAERTVNFETDKMKDLIDEIDVNNTESKLKSLLEKIAELPDDELELIELRYFEQRPFKEVSELLNISESNAKVKVHRIIKKLKMAV